jgi:L-threonylcarbamoyladenylate synthase
MPDILRLSETGLSLLVERCVELLKRGGLAVFPTDTVYGLAAKADDRAAVAKMKQVKGSDSQRAMVVMVSSPLEASQLISPRERRSFRRLASLWPGPLTLVARAGDVPWRSNVAPAVETLGIRIPEQPFLLQVLELSGPLAVTSANLAGGKATASFRELDERLLTLVDVAVDGGNCGSGKPSTVAELRNGEFTILRQGEITEENLHGEPSKYD